jgi:hypothetical protein
LIGKTEKLKIENTSLQQTLQDTQKKMEQAVTKIQKVQVKSQEDKATLEKQSSELIKVGADLNTALQKAQNEAQKAQNEALKYAQKEQVLAQEQVKAKAKEEALVAENKKILDEAERTGEVNAQQILQLKDNMQRLKSMFEKTHQDFLSLVIKNEELQKQLGQTRQRPSIWTRFMSLFRAKQAERKGEYEEAPVDMPS